MKKGFFNAAKIGGDYERFTEEVRRGTPAAAFGVSSAVKYLLASVIGYDSIKKGKGWYIPTLTDGEEAAQ